MHISVNHRGLLRRGLIAAAACAMAGMAAGGPLTGHAAADTDNCGPNLSMTCAGAVESVSANGQPATAVASCSATFSAATAAAVEAVGVSCWLALPDGTKVSGTTHTLWLPGVTSAIGFDVPGLDPTVHYQVCVEGGYITVLGSVNDVQNPVCGGIVA